MATQLGISQVESQSARIEIIRAELIKRGLLDESETAQADPPVEPAQVGAQADPPAEPAQVDPPVDPPVEPARDPAKRGAAIKLELIRRKIVPADQDNPKNTFHRPPAPRGGSRGSRERGTVKEATTLAKDQAARMLGDVPEMFADPIAFFGKPGSLRELRESRDNWAKVVELPLARLSPHQLPRAEQYGFTPTEIPRGTPGKLPGPLQAAREYRKDRIARSSRDFEVEQQESFRTDRGVFAAAIDAHFPREAGESHTDRMERLALMPGAVRWDIIDRARSGEAFVRRMLELPPGRCRAAKVAGRAAENF